MPIVLAPQEAEVKELLEAREIEAAVSSDDTTTLSLDDRIRPCFSGGKKTAA